MKLNSKILNSENIREVFPKSEKLEDNIEDILKLIFERSEKIILQELKEEWVDYIFQNIINKQKLANPKYLDLSKCSLMFLPENFSNLKSLTTLDLSDNPLSSLPESFGNL
ncbi:MAG: hypothetical protein ACTSRZ_20235, partial [Promethearchaeota archaeon]